MHSILSQIRFGTFLNIAASLANPALPHYTVRGVYSRDLVESVAMAMSEMDYQRAFVVHGVNEDGTEGMEEVSTIGETIIAELHEEGEITTYTVTPEEFGISRRTLESGKALAKLREWIREQNSDAEHGENKLECLLREMGAN